MAGMQLDRIGSFFTIDQIRSGIIARFIFTLSDYIHLNENIDHFSARRKVCDEWRDKVVYLFKRGAYDFFRDDQPYNIPFTDEAKQLIQSTQYKINSE